MAQTTFKLAASKVDTPLTAGDTPSAQKTSSGGKTGAGNQGFLTDASVSKDIISTVSTPMVSGAFLFAGIILLLALVAKIKKNKTSNFKDSLTRKHYTTRILGFAAFLTLAAGLGGTMARFMGVEAEAEDFATSGTVNARLMEIGTDYRLYCGTDTITINKAKVPYGYTLFMHPDEDGILTSHSAGVTNIASAEDWGNLGVGEWGYYSGPLIDFATTKSPMPINHSVVSNEADETTRIEIPVTYCAKLSRNIETAEFSATLSYEIIPKEEYDIYPEIDFNSTNDDDHDGISNREENRYGMNPLSADSDMDSLSDYDELKVYHTDPLIEDTDEDGLYDYTEVAFSTNQNNTYNNDPLNPHSFDPDKLDGEYTYNYSGEQNGIHYNITGNGNIPITYIDTVNPTDVDESLELDGTAYMFQSAGEVLDAEIVVPYRQEGEGNTELGESYGGIEVSDDTATEDNIYAISLTFDEPEDAEDGDSIPAISSDADIKSIDNENQTITIDVASNQQLLLVGNDSTMDNDEFGETYGGIISDFFKKVKEKIKSAWDYTWTYIKNAFSRIGQGGSSGGVETWSVSSNFQVGRDTFDFANPTGYYDEAKNKYYDNGGLCYGMAHLARLLYKNRINLSIEHDTGRPKGDFDGKFSLIGLDKNDILKGSDVKYHEGTHYAIGAQGRALYAIQVSYFNYDELDPDSEENTNKFLRNIKEKIDKNNADNGGDDPIVMTIYGNHSHSVNVVSMKFISNKSNVRTYKLKVYDSNTVPYKIVSDLLPWTMKCSLVTCTIKATTSNLGDEAMPTYDFPDEEHGENYYLNH